MKKFVFALLAVAATLSLASCAEDIMEENGNDSPVLDSNTIALTLDKGVATRSMDVSSPVSHGASIALGDPADGRQFYLDETVVSLDGGAFYAPMTKGTPVYTENFEAVSGGSFRGLAFPVQTLYDARASSATIADGDFTLEGSLWKRSFTTSPWNNNSELLLFAKMLTEAPLPVNANTTGVIPDSYRYFYTDAGVQYFTFSYRSAETAQDQQDILFAGRKIAKSEASTPYPILFHHALTGVKFATGHENDGNTKTYIEKVEITGIFGYGKCTVTPQTENGGYTDQSGVHSSADAISWDLTGNNALSSKEKTYYQVFDGTVDYPAGGSFATNGDYPASFSNGGNVNNLNDSDATMTFWFIPQAMTDDVKLTVTFRIVKGSHSESFTREVDFGTKLSGVVWKAGELRTYTLKAGAVDVDITDTVNGYEKSDVVITNTGNVNAFIRAQIVANWFGKMGDSADAPEGAAFGYIGDTNTLSMPWELDYGSKEDNYHGKFTGLPGEGWVRANDGFFYYTEAVEPGNPTGANLFDTYSLDTETLPDIRYQDVKGGRKPFQDLHLVMQIPVQAIEAKAEYADYKEAWAAAGVTVTTD